MSRNCPPISVMVKLNGQEPCADHVKPDRIWKVDSMGPTARNFLSGMGLVTVAMAWASAAKAAVPPVDLLIPSDSPCDDFLGLEPSRKEAGACGHTSPCRFPTSCFQARTRQ